MSPHTGDTNEEGDGKVDSVFNTIDALQSLQSATSVTAVFPLLGRTVSLMLDILKGIHSRKVCTLMQHWDVRAHTSDRNARRSETPVYSLAQLYLPRL